MHAISVLWDLFSYIVLTRQKIKITVTCTSERGHVTRFGRQRNRCLYGGCQKQMPMRSVIDFCLIDQGFEYDRCRYRRPDGLGFVDDQIMRPCDGDRRGWFVCLLLGSQSKCELNRLGRLYLARRS